MTEYSFKPKDSLLGAQMLFVAFGALVLVPMLTGLDTNVALFTSGVGTLLFQWITKRQIPIYLASSFAFIAPIMHGAQTWGIPATMGGLFLSGIVYIIFAGVIKIKGKEFLLKVLPPVVTSPVIMVIGLSLAPVAVFMATGKTGDGTAVLFDYNPAIIMAGVALITTALVSLLGKGIFRLIPILCGMLAGYITALLMGVVNFTPILKAPWFAVPNFVTPQFQWEAILFILPVAIAPAIEHVGDIMAIGSVCGKNFIEKPGLHRTLLGDGIASSFASLLVGPPNTTYSEVSGAVALTRCFNPGIMTWASISAIVLSFVGKLGAFLQTIPSPVMGGIMIILFGAITVVGVSGLVKNSVDVLNSRNLIIMGVILVFGIGGMSLAMGSFEMKGIGLAGVVGILLNLLLPYPKEDEKEQEKKAEETQKCCN